MPNGKIPFKFDGDKYIKDLHKSLTKAHEEAIQMLHQQIKANLQSIKFKDNKVRMAGGVVTSDAKRKGAVIANIVANYTSSTSSSILRGRVRYISDNFEDAHIGIYYEHGIGSNWDGIDAKIPIASGTSSSAKNGGRVVSRSARIDYGIGKGMWIDLGGNKRITGSKKAGRSDAGFMKYIGEETHAYHWFRKAQAQRASDIRKLFRQAIDRVNIFNKKYWRYHKTFTLGRDGKYV